LNARSVTLVALLALSGMARTQTTAAVWLDVPFVPQPRDGCGAASISMVIQYWNAQAGRHADTANDVAAIQRLLYSPRDHGIRASSMVEYFSQHGFRAFAFSGSWDDLDQHLRKGRPLIAALKPRGQAELHYVVIDGIDPVHSLVTMNDPAERKLLTEERAAFEKDWSATHNWLLLAVPSPGR
jgi:ABC-type bacteriocin/lantibiotic exporter with double-glycine peptidase domain